MGGRPVNHFASRGVLPGLIEMVMAPFSAAIGFRPDLEEAEFARHAGIEIIESRPVNAFGYWKLIRCRNKKPESLRSY